MSDPKTINLGRVTGKSAYEYAKDNGYTGAETEFGSKLNDLTSRSIDTTPVEGSSNLITSGAVAEALANAVNALTTETWTFTLDDGSTVTKAVYVG